MLKLYTDCFQESKLYLNFLKLKVLSPYLWASLLTLVEEGFAQE
jgi:hypothetical protein